MKIVHWFEGDLFFPQISGGSTHVESLIRGMPSYEHEVLVLVIVVYRYDLYQKILNNS